jgi:hypothetical protein
MSVVPMVACGSHGDLLELEEDPQLATLVSKWDFKSGQRFEDDIFSMFRSFTIPPLSVVLSTCSWFFVDSPSASLKAL